MTKHSLLTLFSNPNPHTTSPLEQIIDIVPDVIIIMNIHQEILYFNQGAENIFGYSKQEVIGQLLDILIPDAAVEKHRHHVSTFVRGSVNARMKDAREEIAGKRKNGEIFPAEATISKVEFDGELFFAVILRDISRRKAVEEEIRQQNRDLDAFSHTVAHNLKNPIAVVIGYSSLLLDDYETINEQEQVKILHDIKRTSQQANKIVEELLLLAHIRKADVTHVPLNMAAIVEQVQRRLKEMILQSGATIQLPDKWHEAVGYPAWIEEVWSNYLSNGINYGGSPAHLTLGSTQLSEGKIQFWVKDRGTGLTPKQQAVLFTEFTRLGQGKSHGHGLGLSIVKRIVTKLGGEVGLESTVGEGSIFYFTLPAYNSPEESTQEENVQRNE